MSNMLESSCIGWQWRNKTRFSSPWLLYRECKGRGHSRNRRPRPFSSMGNSQQCSRRNGGISVENQKIFSTDYHFPSSWIHAQAPISKHTVWILVPETWIYWKWQSSLFWLSISSPLCGSLQIMIPGTEHRAACKLHPCVDLTPSISITVASTSCKCSLNL